MYNLKEAWFSDPSTYPLLTILGVTSCLIVGFAYNAMRYYKDIRVNPAHKHEVLRSWGEEPTHSVVHMLARRGTVGPHARDYKSLPDEGLGVDHQQWLKQKEKEAQQ